MSRLRKVDRQVLDTSSELLDSDDQAALIDHLSAANARSYHSHRRLLTVALLGQLPVVIYLEHHHRADPESRLQLRPLLILLANMLTLVNLRELAAAVVSPVALSVPRIVTLVNAGICGRLVYSLWCEWGVEKLYYLLPAINLGTLVLFQWWYVQTTGEVAGLSKLTYKYKTV